VKLVKRVTVAVASCLAGFGFYAGTQPLPDAVERAAITAGLMVLTPEMEGTRFEAYPDTGGVWTICTGHTKGVRRGDRASEEECAAYLRADLGASVDFVMARAAKPVPLLCKVAIADMAYNVGPTALGRSTLLRLANAGEIGPAADQFMRWRYVGGLDCAKPSSNCGGIMRRREIQRALCLAQF